MAINSNAKGGISMCDRISREKKLIGWMLLSAPEFTAEDMSAMAESLELTNDDGKVCFTDRECLYTMSALHYLLSRGDKIDAITVYEQTCVLGDTHNPVSLQFLAEVTDNCPSFTLTPDTISRFDGIEIIGDFEKLFDMPKSD